LPTSDLAFAPMPAAQPAMPMDNAVPSLPESSLAPLPDATLAQVPSPQDVLPPMDNNVMPPLPQGDFAAMPPELGGAAVPGFDASAPGLPGLDSTAMALPPLDASGTGDLFAPALTTGASASSSPRATSLGLPGVPTNVQGGYLQDIPTLSPAKKPAA
jgi:hypothetical protein